MPLSNEKILFDIKNHKWNTFKHLLDKIFLIISYLEGSYFFCLKKSNPGRAPKKAGVI